MKFVLMLVAILVMATNTACGSSPASPSAVSTPMPTTPTIQVNVEVATKSLVRYTCSGTPGFSWEFEVYYVGPGLFNRAPSENPVKITPTGCGDGGMTFSGPNVNATSVLFRASRPDAPRYELSVSLVPAS